VCRSMAGIAGCRGCSLCHPLSSYFPSFSFLSFCTKTRSCNIEETIQNRPENADPMHGCQIGTKCPILHAK
jgi:hypothetical protein